MPPSTAELSCRQVSPVAPRSPRLRRPSLPAGGTGPTPPRQREEPKKADFSQRQLERAAQLGLMSGLWVPLVHRTVMHRNDELESNRNFSALQNLLLFCFHLSAALILRFSKNASHFAIGIFVLTVDEQNFYLLIFILSNICYQSANIVWLIGPQTIN